MVVQHLFGKKPKKENTDMVFAPYVMEYPNPSDDSTFTVIANPGWAPFQEHIYIHEVLANNQRTRVTDASQLKMLFETVKEDLVNNNSEIKGVYIKRHLYERAADMWQSEGFSKYGQAMPGSSPVHVMTF